MRDLRRRRREKKQSKVERECHSGDDDDNGVVGVCILAFSRIFIVLNTLNILIFLSIDFYDPNKGDYVFVVLIYP